LRIVVFCHSLESDWNHGNAHFLRGIVTELTARGHAVDVREPANGWSARNLVEDAGPEALEGYRAAYPGLSSRKYDASTLDLDETLRLADLVLVHEWTAPELANRIGCHHRAHLSYKLLFHDTHHRAVSAPEEMAAFDLSGYDGVLAFGDSLRRRYLETHPGLPVWTWHEAADVRVFKPMQAACAGDLVWIGNWGDHERTRELTEFLLEPVEALKLRARVHGVRYPESARQALAGKGIEYCGWLANYRVPQVFAQYPLTVHIPRGPYTRLLPGIPTIRVFEALACAIPLISAPWQDSEGLFKPGTDFLMAANGQEMRNQLRRVLDSADLRAELAWNGLRAIHERHSCAHRVNELMEIART
jgi:spore maturation protein CgeB